MSILALFFALLLEQSISSGERNRVYTFMRRWSLWVASVFDTWRAKQWALVWVVVIVVPALGVWLVHWVLLHELGQLGGLLGLMWSIAVLYVTLGFRQFSHHFTQIRQALESGSDEQAKHLLAQWLQVDVTDLSRTDLVRQVIQISALAAHRQVFGVIFWYSIPAAFGFGPAGAVVYRLAGELPRWFSPIESQLENPNLDPALVTWVQRAWYKIDWPAARMTAITFAIVGNFEEAIDSWRNRVQSFPDDNDGVVLAATFGALSLRPDVPPPDVYQGSAGAELASDPTRTAANDLHLSHLRSIAGMAWRSVVMWLVLLLLLTLANLLG